MDKEYRYIPMQKQAGWDDFVNFISHPVKSITDAAANAGRAAASAAGEYLQGKPVLRATSDKTKGSWLSTINPISGLTGGIDYVPARWYEVFTKGKDPGTKEYDDALKNAHLSWKSLAIGLLTAGTVGGYNILRHSGEDTGLGDGSYAGHGMAEDLSTTFTGDITGVSDYERRKRRRWLAQQKEASLQKKADPTEQTKVYNTQTPENFSAHNFLQTALPIGAMLLAGGLAWHSSNEAYNARHNEDLTDAIEAKRDALKRIVAERARLAKGTVMHDPVRKTMRGIDDDEIYTKDASLKTAGVLGGAVQITGLALSAILLASAIGSYHFIKASDKNNLAYAAYSKALKEYAKNRASVTPLAIEPDEAQAYFDYINNTQEPVKKRTAREQPDIDTDALNKPISISI